MTRRSIQWLGRGLAVTALTAAVAASSTAQAAPWNGKRLTFADPRFEQVWRQSDANPGNRSLTWGPQPWFDYREFYKQSPHGLRLVQYFDKTRMEINDPGVTTGPLGGVTNGLLARELITGRVKLGDGDGPDQYDQRTPANIPVAGDLLKVNPNAPTYASFGPVTNGVDPHVGERVGSTLDKSGNIGFRQDLAAMPGTDNVVYYSLTRHNVPRVFEDYRNSGAVAAIVAFGYPITDAYWVRAVVGGTEKDVMVQVYERRVLTYTPSNNDPYKVEMGNVGQHYFQWRYSEMGTPWDTTEPYLPVAFASNRATPGHAEIFTTDALGKSQSQITAGGSESLPSSLRRSWDQKQVLVIGSSRRDTGKLQLYALGADGSKQQRLLTSTANDYDAAASPDGTKVAFASDRTGRTELFVMNMRGTGVAQVTTNTAACVSDHPSWLPDGTGLIFESNCGGSYAIYRGQLQYTQDKLNDVQATLTNVTRLTNDATADRAPHLSPDGTRIAFEANRDGNPEVYVMNVDGSLQRRLTNSNASDTAPAWSADGSQLVFQSNRSGHWELYVMSSDSGNNQVQITNTAKDSYMPVWAQ